MPPCTGGAVVCPDDGAVDDVQGVGVVAATRQGLRQHVLPAAGPSSAGAADARSSSYGAQAANHASARQCGRSRRFGVQHAVMVKRKTRPQWTNLDHKRAQPPPGPRPSTRPGPRPISLSEIGRASRSSPQGKPLFTHPPARPSPFRIVCGAPPFTARPCSPRRARHRMPGGVAWVWFTRGSDCGDTGPGQGR